MRIFPLVAKASLALLIAGCAQKSMEPSANTPAGASNKDESLLIGKAAPQKQPLPDQPLTEPKPAQPPAQPGTGGDGRGGGPIGTPVGASPGKRPIERMPAPSTPPGTTPLIQVSTPEAPMPSTPVVAAGQAKIGDRTACPVTGTQFLVTGDSPKLDYQGKTYFFCSRTCVDQFKADPKKYLSGPRS